jgi:hypothetical protein
MVFMMPETAIRVSSTLNGIYVCYYLDPSDMINDLLDEDYADLCGYCGGEDKISFDNLANWYGGYFSNAIGLTTSCRVIKGINKIARSRSAHAISELYTLSYPQLRELAEILGVTGRQIPTDKDDLRKSIRSKATNHFSDTLMRFADKFEEFDVENNYGEHTHN